MEDIVTLHYPDVRHANWELLCEAARKQGIRLTSWEPHRLQICCIDDGIWSYYDGKRVRPGVILHRTVAAFQGIVIPALKLWTSEGIIVLNEPDAAYRSRDKLLTSIALQRAQVPIVHTIAFVEPSPEAMAPLKDHHVILKPAHGVRGEGIQAFLSTDELLAAWVDNRGQVPPFPLVREHYVAQPLINGGGRDLRAFVVAGACVALMQRQAAPGEVRANLALGATCTQLPLNHPAARTAVSALEACQLDYGGVDLIEDDDGAIRVLEVDAWAGFAGISAATGTDVAGAILRLAMTRRLEGTAT
ncbi:MAG: ATP-grasp domain-containing protein [Pseudonocardiaceae bacterium]